MVYLLICYSRWLCSLNRRDVHLCDCSATAVLATSRHQVKELDEDGYGHNTGECVGVEEKQWKQNCLFVCWLPNVPATC